MRQIDDVECPVATNNMELFVVQWLDGRRVATRRDALLEPY